MTFRILKGKPPNIVFDEEVSVSCISDALVTAMPCGPRHGDEECLYGIWPHRVYDSHMSIHAPLFCYNSRISEPYIVGEFIFSSTNEIPYDVYQWNTHTMKFIPIGFSLSRIASKIGLIK